MRNLQLKLRLALVFGSVLLLFAVNAYSGRSLQPGFYYHEPEGVGISIDNGSSGPVCSDVNGQTAVCSKATKVTVTGQESCIGTDRKPYPCTRYGYQFDYTGAEPGEAIQCQSTRRDAFRTQSMDYELDLDAAAGSVFQPSWIPYAPVERRMMVTEVHNCSYQGKLLATVEFIVSYEPGTGPTTTAQTGSGSGSGPAPGIDEPYIGEIPNACAYLTEAKAASLLQTTTVQQDGANEHIGNLSSQCDYSGISGPRRSVGYLFKFMLYEMFDIDSLDPMQLKFNVTIAGGGDAPIQTIEELGKMSFVFDNGERTILMVITGIQGPPGGANRPREFIAFYYMVAPDWPHATRLQELRSVAEEHLPKWHGR